MIEAVLAFGIFIAYVMLVILYHWLSPIDCLLLGLILLALGICMTITGGVGYYLRMYQCTPKPWTLWMWLHPPILHHQMSWQQKEKCYTWLVIGMIGMLLCCMAIVFVSIAWLGFSWGVSTDSQ